MSEPISIKSISSRYDISHWQFQRLFRCVINDSVGNYLRKRRLTLAAEKLYSSDANIIDIALEFQFGSHEAFSRSFKSAFNMGPSEYRRLKKRISLCRKPELSEDLLYHMNFSIQRQPQIVEVGELNLVGKEVIIKSPLAYNDFVDQLPKHWEQSFEALKGVKDRVPDKFYGVAADSNIEKESVSYLAAVATHSPAETTTDMTELKIPAATYAVFENQGLADKTQNTMDYIYGFWLPSSDFQRVDLYDFEVFDQRYKIGDKSSISSYYVPIQHR